MRKVPSASKEQPLLHMVQGRPVDVEAYDGDARIGAAAPVDNADNIARFCTDTYADVCAIYIRNHGSIALAFSSSDELRFGRLASSALDDLYTEKARALGIERVLFEPFAVEGRIAGTVVLGFSGGKAMPPAAISTLVSIVATAVEQSKLLALHFDISNRLQRAMLPSRFAHVPGLRLEAAYRPATSESVVGGDWYDAFEIGNGLFGISVGDVTGHGLEAAVAMSEIRRAIRAAAATTQSPTELLNYVDSFMVSQGIGMASAIAGFYDSRTSLLRYACAGHPHPVLVSGTGRAMFLPGGGLILGIGMEPASQEWSVTLTPNTTCYLYTDGLLEYGRDVIAGEIALLEAIESLAAQDLHSAEALHQSVFTHTPNSDDTATLMLQHVGAISHDVGLEYSAVPQSAMLARESLRHLMQCMGVRPEREFDVLTGCGEAVANAIEHCTSHVVGTFIVNVERLDAALSISVTSHGHWRAFTPREERGRGIPIMRAYCSSMNIATGSQSTTVTLGFDDIF